jgi:endonuclease/exonuclease/phosphatase family metal-dependent hydrolase
MRIDHIFADPHWSVEACWTEDERKSQHRAVAAALQWKGDS